jgi:hypothetical protein
MQPLHKRHDRHCLSGSTATTYEHIKLLVHYLAFRLLKEYGMLSFRLEKVCTVSSKQSMQPLHDNGQR